MALFQPFFLSFLPSLFPTFSSRFLSFFSLVSSGFPCFHHCFSSVSPFSPLFLPFLHLFLMFPLFPWFSFSPLFPHCFLLFLPVSFFHRFSLLFSFFTLFHSLSLPLFSLFFPLFLPAARFGIYLSKPPLRDAELVTKLVDQEEMKGHISEPMDRTRMD